jgi:hypothetical protein
VVPSSFINPVLEATITVWQGTSAQNQQLLAVVAPAPPVTRYRLYRRKGTWPTVDGTVSGALSEGFFVCERAVSADGGGVLATGSACRGGLGDPTSFWDTDPNNSTGWATGDIGFFIVVPRWGELVGPRATATYTVINPIGITLPLPHASVGAVRGDPLFRTPGNLAARYDIFPGVTTAAEAAAVVLDFYESIDGDSWQSILTALPWPGSGVLGGRGEGYVAGSFHDPWVTWRWKVVSRRGSEIISTVVSPPFAVQALKLTPSTVQVPLGSAT